MVNGNPLLRFDGYYILSDLIEMPNLAARSTRYWSYLVQRYLLRAPQATTSETTPGEKGWLLFYAPASFAYRLVVVIGIAMLIGSQYFFIGVLLGCWLFAASVVLPVVKILRFGFVAPELAPVRMRTISLIGTGFALIALLLFALPLPERTLARGVVWVPEDTRIVAGVSGFIETVLKPGGSEVTAGDPLLRLEDHTLNVKRQIQEARISELRARLAGAEANSPADLVLMRRELAIALDELSTLRKREDALVIRSPQSGRVYYQHEADLPRLFARSGDLIGHVVTQASGIVRAAIPEHEIDRVRSATGHVAIILDSNPDVVLKDAQLVRQMPEATHVLPSLALSATNGGPFTLDPSAKQEGSVIESLFIVDVQLPVSEPIERWGERATVRFDHGASALAPRLYRLFRQVFLERFHV
jgi:putative peptide zinc metalloprotease protein